ncbi:MAG: hypothetical protein QXE01_09500 [Sulfolobales archaeon]
MRAAIYIALILALISIASPAEQIYAQNPQQWISQPLNVRKIWVDSVNGTAVGASGNIIAIYSDADKTLYFIDAMTMNKIYEFPASILLMDNISRVIDLSAVNREWSGFLVLSKSSATIVDPRSGYIYARFGLPGSTVGFSDNAVYLYNSEAVICLDMKSLKVVGTMPLKLGAASVIMNPQSYGIDPWSSLIRYSRGVGTDPSSPPMATATADRFFRMFVDWLNKTLSTSSVLLRDVSGESIYIPYRSGSLDFRDIYSIISTEVNGAWCRVSGLSTYIAASYNVLSPFTISFTAHAINTTTNEELTLLVDYIARDDGTQILVNGTNIFSLLNITATNGGIISTARIVIGVVEMRMITSVSINTIMRIAVVRAGSAGGFDSFVAIYQPYGGLPVVATYTQDGVLLGSTQTPLDPFEYRVIGSSGSTAALWKQIPVPGQSHFAVYDTSKQSYISLIYSVKADYVELYPSSDGSFLFIAATGGGGDVEIGYVFRSSAITTRILGAASTNAFIVVASRYVVGNTAFFFVASTDQSLANTTIASFASQAELGVVSIVSSSPAKVLFEWNGYSRAFLMQPNTSVQLPLGATIKVFISGRLVFTGVVTKSLDIDLMSFATASNESRVVQQIPPEIYLPRPAQEIGVEKPLFVFANLSAVALKRLSQEGLDLVMNDFYIVVAERGWASIFNRAGEPICRVATGEQQPTRVEMIGRSIAAIYGFWGVSLVDASTCTVISSHMGPASVSPDLLIASWGGTLVKVLSASTGEIYSLLQSPDTVTFAYPVTRGTAIVVAGSAAYVVTPSSVARLVPPNETVISYASSPGGVAIATQRSMIVYTPYTGLFTSNISDPVTGFYWLNGYSVGGVVAVVVGQSWVWAVKATGEITPIMPLQGRQVLGVSRSGIAVGSANSSIVQLYDFSGSLRASILMPFQPSKAIIIGRSLSAIGGSAYYAPDIGEAIYSLSILYASPSDGMPANVSIPEISYERVLRPGESATIYLAYRTNLTVIATAPYMEVFRASVEISDRNRYPAIPINMRWTLYPVNISVYVVKANNMTELAPNASGYIEVAGPGGRYRLDAPGGVLMLRYGNYSVSFISSYYANYTDYYVIDSPRSISINTSKLYTDIFFEVLDEANNPIRGAKIAVEGFGSAVTDARGRASIQMIPLGSLVNVSIGAPGFYTSEKQIPVSDMAIYREILRRITCQLTITVTDANGMPSSATVFIMSENGTQLLSSTVAFTGNFTIPYGRYVVKSPVSQDQPIACASGENISVNIVTPPPPTPTITQTQRPGGIPIIGSQQNLALIILIITIASAMGVIVYRLHRRRI